MRNREISSLLLISTVLVGLLCPASLALRNSNGLLSSCQAALNVELVLDGSGSISSSSWDLVKTFSKGLANSFTLGPNGVIMGIVQFSSSAVVEVPPSTNLDNILSGIQKMQQQRGSTNTFAGINLGQVSLLAAARNNTPMIMILMTDGQSNEGNNPVAAADKAKALGIEIIVMGVGDGVDWNTLNQIATAPAENHRFNVTSFGDLQAFLQKLITKTCLRVESLDPSTGPSSGGTAVIVSGEGFENSGKITCKFGSTIVPGTYGDANHIICKTPAGSGNVVVSISLDGETYSSSSAQFTYITPNPPPAGCPNDCSGNGACFNGKCFCNNGWSGPACNQLPCAIPDCSGHGTCNNGTCICNAGWIGKGCEINACPNNCNNHGVCLNNTCICDQGWSGPDCNIGEIICCRYCSARHNPTYWWAECDISKCSGYPDKKLVESFPVRGAKTKDDCIFHSECIRNTGFCNN